MLSYNQHLFPAYQTESGGCGVAPSGRSAGTEHVRKTSGCSRHTGTVFSQADWSPPHGSLVTLTSIQPRPLWSVACDHIPQTLTCFRSTCQGDSPSRGDLVMPHTRDSISLPLSWSRSSPMPSQRHQVASVSLSHPRPPDPATASA